MKWVKNYLRLCFCRHNFEHIRTAHYYTKYSDIQHEEVIIYRCNKCGYVQKIKL